MSERFPKIHNLGSQIKGDSPDSPESSQPETDTEEVLRLYPALTEIGSAEQYEQYLETIFPDSKEKSIFWHATALENRDTILNKGFDQKVKRNFDTLNSIEGVFNFSTNREFISRYGEGMVPVVLNIRNPIEDSNTGEYGDDLYRPLSEALFKMGKRESQDFAPNYDENLKHHDAFINKISGEYYIKRAPRTGVEIGVPKQIAVAVFDAAQIYVLGSKNDAERFRKFVSEKNSN